MRIAYLLLIHKDPCLLRKLIELLSRDGCGFFIHVDAKTPMGQFADIQREDTSFCPSLPVYWSEFSQIRATRLLLQEALGSRLDYEYFVFLQGSTYPLRGGRYIQQFFQNNRGLEFMNLVKMPAPGYPLSKINTIRYASDKPVRRFAARALAKVGLAQRDYRRYLGRLEAYSGHACWALSRAACEYLLEFDAKNPNVASYFRDVFVPEESFFHTILGNSPFMARVRRNLVYADWSRSEGHHPATLTMEHVKLFSATDQFEADDEWGRGELLFARKVSDEQPEIVRAIDRMIRCKDGASTRNSHGHRTCESPA